MWIDILFILIFSFVRFWLKVQLEMILMETLPLMTFPSWTASHMKVNEYAGTENINFLGKCWWSPTFLIFNFQCWFVCSTFPCSRRARSHTEYHYPCSDNSSPHSSAPQLPWWRVCVWGTWRVCCQQQSVWFQGGLFWWFRWIKLW